MDSRWLIALSGWFGYNLLVWFFQKQTADRKGQRFDYRHFASTHVDDWIVTFVFCVPIVYYGPLIHEFIMAVLNLYVDWHIKWYDIFYAGPGPLVEFLYFFGMKLLPVMKTKVLDIVKRK